MNIHSLQIIWLLFFLISSKHFSTLREYLIIVFNKQNDGEILGKDQFVNSLKQDPSILRARTHNDLSPTKI